MANKMLRHLDELKKQREALAQQVETEEDFITNTLQRKLTQLRREKVDLENQLEQEGEYIMNRMHRQMVVATAAAAAAAAEKEKEREKQPAGTPRTMETSRVIERYEQLVVQLRAKIVTLEKKCYEFSEHSKLLERTVDTLRRETWKQVTAPVAAASPPSSSSSSSSSPSSSPAVAPGSPIVSVVVSPSSPRVKWPLEGGRVRSQSQSTPKSGRMRSPSAPPVPVTKLVGASTPPTQPSHREQLSQVKVLREGRLSTRLDGQPDSSERFYAVLSSGKLVMKRTAETDVISEVIDLDSVLSIVAGEQLTVTLSFKKEPCRFLIFNTPDDCLRCAVLLRDLAPLSAGAT